MKIGFSLLAHREPSQLLRLVTTLNRLYDDPPIACHFDFGQCRLDKAAFPGNVAFVDPSIPTAWAKWSTVAATLSALALLRETADPDWVVLLSGADYPVAPAEKMLADLEASGADALMDFREAGMSAAEAEARFGPINPSLVQFEAVKNVPRRRAHYLAMRYWLPVLRRERGGFRLGRQTWYLPFGAPTAPFSDTFRCYYGDHWFTINRRALDVLLRPTAQHLKLKQHLQPRFCADECYYQTVLCNEPGIVVERHNRRYTQWNGGGAHPADLDRADLPDIFSSRAHFARKFASGAPVLDDIDRRLFGE